MILYNMIEKLSNLNEFNMKCVSSIPNKLVVIDLTNGNILSKVSLKSPLANGMFLTPGLNNDIFYCSTRTVARVSWT